MSNKQKSRLCRKDSITFIGRRPQEIHYIVSCGKSFGYHLQEIGNFLRARAIAQRLKMLTALPVDLGFKDRVLLVTLDVLKLTT